MSTLPQIPGYKILEKIGRGGMSDVYLGIQENLERKVAVKILIPSLFRDEEFCARFKIEARTAAKLTHPNIITIHDVGTVVGSYYIVMEYLEESLKNKLKTRGPLPASRALDILGRITNALAYAHRSGFIHRDLKPDNIMFRSDGTPVLVDFGIARAIDSNTSLTRTGISIGTPHYMSPEQCRGEKVDGRTDIYSLGVVLYETLTGNVPYKAESTAGIILKHIQEPPPSLPENLSRYQPLLDKMMAKNKELRVQTCEELIGFLQDAENGRDFRPTHPSTVTELDASPLRTALSNASAIQTERLKAKDFTGDKSPEATGATGTGNRKSLSIFIGIFLALLTLGIMFLLMNREDTDGPVSSPQTEVERKLEMEKNTVTKEEEAAVETGVTGPPGKQKPPARRPIINDVGFDELSHHLQQLYREKMNRAEFRVKRRRFRLNGTLVLSFSVDTGGRVSAKHVADELNVVPQMFKQHLLDYLVRRMGQKRLAPPRDRAGNSVRLKSWQVKYRLYKIYDNVQMKRVE